MVERLEIFGKIRTLWAVVILNALFVESIKEVGCFYEFSLLAQKSMLFLGEMKKFMQDFPRLSGIGSDRFYDWGFLWLL